MRFAWNILLEQLNISNININRKTLVIDKDKVDAFHPISEAFLNIWSNCADELSKQYTGAGSIFSQATRGNNKSNLSKHFDGLMKSTKRLVESTFKDSAKQESLEYILCRH